ncbi:MAG TPA: polymer-forming cytoskeletal protein [Firmicutes bacterium]|nr:polymer-forming cytoskeletal protein [Bacillota bacterium]
MEDKLNTIVGQESSFKGDFKVAGGLRVDGKLKGNVEAASVFIGEKGEVEGDINTVTAVIGGKVRGNVMAKESLELQKKAVLIGDVVTKSIRIEKGVVFEGYCEMGVGGEKKRRQKQRTKLTVEGKPEVEVDQHGEEEENN